MNAAPDAFAAYLEKLIQARPEHTLVRLFLAPARRDAESAFEALVAELEHTLWQAREAQAAAAKLQWWGEELQRALDGAARHPLTQTLPAAQPTPAGLCRQWTVAALELLDAPALGDFAAQQQAVLGFYAPLAQLECAWLGRGGDSAAPRALAFLLRELCGMADGRAPHALALPLNLLARHQLTRADLTAASAARDALLHDQLRQLSAADAALPAAIDAGLPVRLRRRLDRTLRRHALAAVPGAVLGRGTRLSPRVAWQAWREARRGA